MSLDNSKISGNSESKDKDSVRAKVVHITCKGNRWIVEFEGVVTRRDIKKINRLLSVEFARAQRKYSMSRKRSLKLPIPSSEELLKESLTIKTKETVKNG